MSHIKYVITKKIIQTENMWAYHILAKYYYKSARMFEIVNINDTFISLSKSFIYHIIRQIFFIW